MRGGRDAGGAAVRLRRAAARPEPAGALPGRPRGRIYDENFEHPNKAGQAGRSATKADARILRARLGDRRRDLPTTAPGKRLLRTGPGLHLHSMHVHHGSDGRAAPRQPGHHDPGRTVKNPRLTFVHWFATEPGWDGGNVSISVNGGPWKLIRRTPTSSTTGTRSTLFPRPALLQQQPAGRPAGLRGNRRRLVGRNVGPFDHQSRALRAGRRHDSGPVRLRQRRPAPVGPAGTSTT